MGVYESPVAIPMSTNPESPVVEVGDSINGTTGYLLNPSIVGVNSVALPIDKSLISTDAYSAPAAWYKWYDQEVSRRLTDAASWIHDENETQGWRNTAHIGNEWHVAQRAAHQEAIASAFRYMRDNVIVIPATATTTNSPFIITDTAGTAVTSATLTWTTMEEVAYDFTPEQMIALKLQRRHLARHRPVPRNHRNTTIRSFNSDELFQNAAPAEIVALQLLRKMVSQEEFRRYLKHGFINVRGSSGLTYQIRRHSTIVVWERGEEIAHLCVHLHIDTKTPPTDHIVGKMLIIECDEADIWKRSNITWNTNNRDRESLKSVGQHSKEGSDIVSGGINIGGHGLYTTVVAGLAG